MGGVHYTIAQTELKEGMDVLTSHSLISSSSFSAVYCSEWVLETNMVESKDVP